MKQFAKIRGINAWYEIPTRTLYVKSGFRTIGKGKNKRKIAKKIAIQTPQPDVLYNNSVYTYLVNWIYVQGYEVYLLHNRELRRVGQNRFDDFRLMIDDLLNDYFAKVSKVRCKVSPMVTFSMYDYGNSLQHKRKVVIIALDETDFTCVPTMSVNISRFFASYFGLVYAH